jgi:hypothetical protein
MIPMKTKFAAALVAALTIGTVAVSGTSQAQAHHWHGGWGWGGVGLGLALGAAAASTYYAPSCYWTPQYDRFGNYLGRVKVCNY